MEIKFQVIERKSKKGNTFKALYAIIDGKENFICFIK